MNKNNNIKVGSYVSCEDKNYTVISISRGLARLEDVDGKPCGMAPLSRLTVSSGGVASRQKTPWVQPHQGNDPAPRPQSSGGSSVGIWVLGIGAAIALLMSIIGGGVVMIAGAILMAAESK